jgi:hypothetical protein
MVMGSGRDVGQNWMMAAWRYLLPVFLVVLSLADRTNAKIPIATTPTRETINTTVMRYSSSPVRFGQR